MTWKKLAPATEEAGMACPTYKNPPKIQPVPTEIYRASDIIKRTYVQDWLESINDARAAYAKAGGSTNRPLTQAEVEKVLKQAGKALIVEDEAVWKSLMGLFRAQGIAINDIGIASDCTAVLGSARDKGRIVLNPYIKNQAQRWGTQIHEIEHVAKELAGVPSSAQMRGTSQAEDTVHHRTSRADKPTILRWEQAPPLPLYKRLFKALFD